MKSSGEEKVVSPYLVLGFGILAVSTASIFIRYAQQMAPSLAIGAFRLLIAAAILAPFAFSKNAGEIREFDRKKWGLIILAGGLPGAAFCSLDHLAGIHNRGKLSCPGHNRSPLGSNFLTDPLEGEDYAFDDDRHLRCAVGKFDRHIQQPVSIFQ